MATILKGAPVVAAMNERNAALCEQLKAKRWCVWASERMTSPTSGA